MNCTCSVHGISASFEHKGTLKKTFDAVLKLCYSVVTPQFEHKSYHTPLGSSGKLAKEHFSLVCVSSATR